MPLTPDQDRVAELEDALRFIRGFPEGWRHRGSITDFITDVLQDGPWLPALPEQRTRPVGSARKRK